MTMLTFVDWIDIGILLREKYPGIECNWMVMVVPEGLRTVQIPIYPMMPEVVPMYRPPDSPEVSEVVRYELANMERIRTRSGALLTLAYEPETRRLIFWDCEDLHVDGVDGPERPQVLPFYVLLAWNYDNPRQGWNAFRQTVEGLDDPDINEYLTYDVMEVIDLTQCKRVLLWRNKQWRRP